MKALITLSQSPLGGMETFSSHLSETFPDLRIIDYSQSSYMLSSKIPFPLATMPQIGMSICRHFLKMQRKWKADLVFTSGLYGWYLSLKGAGVPIVNTLHGVATDFAVKAYKKFSFDYYRMKYVYSLAERISARNSISVCNSNFTRSLIKSRYHVESKVIYNAVDTKNFYPIPKKDAREMLSLPDRTTAIFVGPLTYSKGFDIIRQLAALHPEVDFLCVSFQKAPSSLKNLKIIPNVGHSELSTYYSAADFCIFPSRFEGFGYVPLEALACNTPVIANKTGILTEFSPLGSFTLSQPDLPAYSRCIEAFPNNFKYSKTHTFIRDHFSLKRFSREYKNLAEKILKGEYERV